MRPARFQTFLLDTLSTAGVKAQSLADAGDSKHPYGIVATGPGGETRWQIIGRLAEGERHDNADTPVAGTPAAMPETSGGDATEGWLAEVIGRAESPEIATIERWSTREGAKAAGLTVTYHNGAMTYVRRI
jgi:hypothetical protein